MTARHSARLRTPRILVVEDREVLRNGMKRFLERENTGWEILTAADEDEGVKILKGQLASKEPVAVVVIDLNLHPENKDDMSGMDMLHRARSEDQFVMVILYSDYSNLLKRYEALEAGAFDVVLKRGQGINYLEEIKVKVRSALKYRQLEDRIHYLGRYFDPKLFEMIESKPELLDLQERTVTICFWDIERFSQLSDQLKKKPELVSNFLRDYYDLAANTILARGGVVDRFIGDGVMAIFGVFSPVGEPGSPVVAAAQRNDAVAAVQAAKEIRAGFDSIVRTWMPKWEFATQQEINIGLRCGINTGEALVGNTGSDTRDQFSALGDCVNLAAHFEKEANGKKRQILITQSTKSLVEQAVRVVYVRKIKLTKDKDLPGAFPAYEVSP
jgi:adenylate cyclase